MQETMIERITRLVKEKGVSEKTFCNAIGVAQSTFVNWKKRGTEPKAAYIKPISEFLGISERYLLTGEDSVEDPELTEKDKRDITKDLDNLMRKIKNGDDGPLRYNGAEIDEQSLQLLESAINMSLRDLKITNKEKYNPNKNKK